MPVVSQSIMKPMVPVGASTEACALRQPLSAPISRHSCHWAVAALSTSASSAPTGRIASLAAACLRMTRACASALRAKPSYGADDAGQLGRAAVGGAGHQRGDRRRQGLAAARVVGVAGGHEQRAEVGVADAQLAVGAGGLADRLGREVGEADGDVHRRDDQLDGLHEVLRVERAVVLEELHEVQRGQVARAVVEAHVLRARVGRVDAAGLGVGVPVVDRVVVLDARVGALPRGLGDLAEQRLGVDGLDDRAVHAGAQPEVARRPRPRA